MMNAQSKSLAQMTAAELDQRMFEITGLKHPPYGSPPSEFREYMKASYLILGMRYHKGDKAKAKAFMKKHYRG